MKFKAVFLDKDGTLIPDIPYNVDTKRITLSDGAVEGLQLLQSYGYLLVIITNQSGLAFGNFTLEQLVQVKKKIHRLCAKKGIYLDGFYYCPHHPDATVSSYRTDCHCRKPEPGLISKAAEDMNIDVSSSWMIGDILNDVEAGNRAGCKTVLIDNGNETEWITGEQRVPAFKARDLADAAKYILAATNITGDEKDVGRQKEYTVHTAG